MVGALFLMIKFIFKQIETVHVGTDQHVLDPPHPWGSLKNEIVHVCNRATCFGQARCHVCKLTLCFMGLKCI